MNTESEDNNSVMENGTTTMQSRMVSIDEALKEASEYKTTKSRRNHDGITTNNTLPNFNQFLHVFYGNQGSAGSTISCYLYQAWYNLRI